MGHNRNYSNFSRHFNKPENNNVVENIEDKNEEVLEGQVDVEELINNDTPDTVTEVVEENSKEVIGYVSGCEKLNLRKEASKDSSVVTILYKYAELQIDESKSTEEFYKVTTLAGIEGYCMKKFISVR